MIRLASFAAMLLIWLALAHFSDARHLPGPIAVAQSIFDEAQSGELLVHLGATLARVGAAFAIAMSVGSVLGYLMGRNHLANKILDPWLVLLLNLPALVVIVLAYIWAGLNEAAAIGAVALNKLPGAMVFAREGARAQDSSFDDMAHVFRLTPQARLRHIVLPQLAPYLAASARSGLALVWKIVLIVELLGRPNGVGFKINLAFQLFDLRLLFAYALPFVAIMLVVEVLLAQPLEKYVSRWRLDAARRRP